MDILTDIKEQGKAQTELPAWLAMRYAWKENDDRRDRENAYPADVIQIKNLDYKEMPDEQRFHQAVREAKKAGADGLPIGWYAPAGKETEYAEDAYASNSRMDIYFPKNEWDDAQRKGKGIPVIVSVHGGAWFYGDKERYSYYGCHLAEYGFSVVNFNYRLSPQNKYPAAVADVAACMHFVCEHAETFGFDRENLFMVGDSAGAQLTANYCILAANEDYRHQMDFFTYDKLPNAVCLNCGGFEWDQKKGDFYDWYVKNADGSLAVEEHALELLHKQMGYVNAEFPPTYLMYSVNDPLKGQTIHMEERMAELEILHELHAFGKDHPECGHVFHLNMQDPEGQRCNKEEMEFLKRYLNSLPESDCPRLKM